MNKNNVYILEDRGILYIKGEDVKDYLQNIISNDLNKVNDNQSCFASILTPQGKYLFDFIIIKYKKGYLLDGFPRTIPQAEGLDEIMKNISHTLDGAISLTADEDELVQRLINRGLESGRSDDTPEVIRQRQKVYWNQTAPLLKFYRQKNLLKVVDGLGDIPKITDRILGLL